MNPRASAPPPQLRELQEWFQGVVTGRDATSGAGGPTIEAAGIDRILTPSSRLSAAERLAVYTNAYSARLIDCLTQMFPVLARTLGEDVFAGFSRDYLQSHPSRSYTLSVLGEGFPRFLADSRPPRESGAVPDWADFMADLAALEWIIYEVFDAVGTEDAPGGIGDALGNLPSDRWPELHLVTAPCLRLARFRFPVNEYYTKCRRLPAGAECPPFPDPAEEHVAVSRVDYVVRRYPLEPASHRILECLSAGGSLGEAMEAAWADVRDRDPSRIAADLGSWFALWQREGFFQAAAIR